MVSKSFLVKNYMIRLGYEMSAMFDDIEIKARGIIQCEGIGTSDEADNRFIMYFLTEDSPIPKPFYDVATETAAIFLPFRDMGQFVDLLRNEEPLSVVLDSDRPEWSYIGSTREPVGEAE